MARKATEFPAQGVQMSDFKRTRNMTKKDWGIAKQYLDGILADVEKRDREILNLCGEITEERKSTLRKLAELRDRKDYEIGVLKKKVCEFEALYRHEKGKNTTLIAVAIVACLIMLIESILFFF